MKQLLMFAVLTSIAFPVLAQPGENSKFWKPDLDQLEKEVSDSNSAYYYPALYRRYVSNDSTLSVEDFRHLYLGFSFQPGYNSYGKSEHAERIKKLQEDRSPTRETLLELIRLEEELLEEFPYNLRNLYTLANLYGNIGDSVNANNANNRMVGVAKAIASTGDGLDASTAMFVISVEHEYDMIRLLGFMSGGMQKLVPVEGSSYDYLTLEKNEEGIKGLYFNIDRLFSFYKNLFKK